MSPAAPPSDASQRTHALQLASAAVLLRSSEHPGDGVDLVIEILNVAEGIVAFLLNKPTGQWTFDATADEPKDTHGPDGKVLN